MINKIEDLQNLVAKGETDFKQYGHVRTFLSDCGNLIGFDYTPEAEYEANWNAFERMSRGLVLEVGTGNIVARPYDKFFNLGQHNEFPKSKITTAFEKADGSLGIIYMYKGELRCNTRGSFKSDQAVACLEMAKEMGIDKWFEYFYDIHEYTPTLLVEIVYPENRIVVDYDGWSGLILHGGRLPEGDYFDLSGLELTCAEINHPDFRLAKTFDVTDVDAVKSLVESFKGVECEGIVILCEDGERFKIKGEDYLRLHRIVTDVTPKRVWDLLCNGDYNEYKKQIPDEFLDEFENYADEIINQVTAWVDATEDLFQIAVEKGLTETTQKDYALWVQTQEKFYHKYLFMLKAGKNIEQTFLLDWKKLTGYTGA
jgi:RNA ligase